MAEQTPSFLNEDAVIALVDLAGRAGAKDLEIGFLHDDVPMEEAGWYATAHYQGARLTVEDHRSPGSAAFALAERLLTEATCRCSRSVSLADDGQGCHWRLMGRRWEPGCDAPPIQFDGDRGDVPAIRRAFGAAAPAGPPNRAARRARPRRGGR